MRDIYCFDFFQPPSNKVYQHILFQLNSDLSLRKATAFAIEIPHIIRVIVNELEAKSPHDLHTTKVEL